MSEQPETDARPATPGSSTAEGAIAGRQKAETAADLPPNDSARRVEHLLSCSEFIRDFRDTRREAFDDIVAHLDSPPAAGGITRLGDDCDPAEAAAHLRTFRNVRHVDILARDLLGIAPLEETLARLTQTAEQVIRYAVKAATCDVARTAGYIYSESGTADGPREPAWMTVIAMGKLGAGELNFSSDIDLIFVYRDTAQSSDGRRSMEAQQWFERVARNAVKLMTERTRDGFCYRVDLRLRPFGDSGPVVISLAALEHYLLVHGRDWERYAMIKARPVCGDLPAVLELSRLVRPFVYRRYLDFGAVTALREMKALISREVHRSGRFRDIKRGAGGIREIEFIGQVFQLMRGGQERELQMRCIMDVLPMLAERGLLSVADMHALLESYRLLRVTENRLQGIRDDQTHDLPESESDRQRLVNAMGAEGWSGLESELRVARAAVSRVFDALLGVAPGADTERPSAEAADEIDLDHLNLDAASTDILKTLSGFGAVDAEATLAALRTELPASFISRLSSEARQRLERVLPRLLAGVDGTDDPLTTLTRTLKLLVAVSRRSVYLAALVEFPKALGRVIELFAASPWIAEEITRHPGLLDDLLDSEQLYGDRSRTELEQLLENALARVDVSDEERLMEVLRRFTHSQRLRVAASDITSHIPVNRVSDLLTVIAEVVIERTLRLAWDLMVARHGRPMLEDQVLGVCVVAYGKLGGIELGYGSDLDLVFVHDDLPAELLTDGARPIEASRFFARVAQRFIHLMSTPTLGGRAYEIDVRLRPSGNAGLMVVSASAFAQYQTESAWTWEHQALVRARPVAGSAAARERFSDIRRAILTRSREPNTLRDEVLSMRAKMRENLDRSSAAQFDLKQGVGGITDLEFVVQYLVLLSASRHPALVTYTDNWRLLEDLGAAGVLPEKTVASLVDAYFALRARGHRLSLLGRPQMMELDELPDAREAIASAWRDVFSIDAH